MASFVQGCAVAILLDGWATTTAAADGSRLVAGANVDSTLVGYTLYQWPVEPPLAPAILLRLWRAGSPQ